MDIHREMYIPSPRPHTAPWIAARYVGSGVKREETLSFMTSSDWPHDTRRRTSDDDGRTWTPWRKEPDEHPIQGEFTRLQSVFARVHPPAGGLTVQAVLVRLLRGDPREALVATARGDQQYFDHMFWQVSDDEGESYGPLRLFRYEDGPEFDEADWGNPAFLRSNQMYGGYNMIVLRDGRLAYPAIPRVQWPNPQGRMEAVRGLCVFFGRRRGSGTDYQWRPSQPLAVPLATSGRGLSEPVVAQLSDGRILVLARGSSTPTTPGRRWMTVGSEDGEDWSPITDLRYDDQEQFYSPATMSRLIRSRKTGKLYWIGNISRRPPEGNMPRYPLVIAEVDEASVTLKRASVVVIDDRDPATDSHEVQLSNFHLLENRTTLDLEIYLTKLGQRSHLPPELWTADAYKYVIRL